MSRAFHDDVLRGLRSVPKTLPCKYFYDARGSELFEQICELDEYYVTRADFDATERHARAIAARIGPGALIVELGSGASVKTRILLDALDDVRGYVPIDISDSALEASCAALRQAYPRLEVMPLSADYTQPFTLPAPSQPVTRTVVYYPGSTIGNFHPPAAAAFLRRIAALVGPAGAALVGIDLVKDVAVLERAYDDAAGVTAAFNKNLLARINRELGADFALDAFRHVARFDVGLSRIEMYLESLVAQTVRIGDERIAFAAGEMTRTEESYKYTPESFARIAGEGGFAVDASWYDEARRFSLQWLIPQSARSNR